MRFLSYLLLVVVVTFPVASRGALLFSETFPDPNGPLVPGSGGERD